jgi:hypothetical protein
MAGLTIAAWLVWNDAVLTSAFPINSAARGVAGDRLPNASRFSGNFSLDHNFPLGTRVSAFVGGSVSYFSDSQGKFTGTAQRQMFPAYARTDLHAGAKYDSWTGSLFVTNLANRRGVLAGGLGTLLPNGFFYIQPRTIGLSVAKAF